MPLGFKTQGALKRKLEKIYSHYPETSRIRNSDDLFLRDLMAYHPIHNNINNIKYFVLLRQSRNHPVLVYVSRVHEGFYNKYINQHVVYCNPLLVFTKDYSQIHKVNMSFRNAIKKNLVRAKKDWFGKHHINHCQLTGTPITYKQCSVHHLYNSFSNIVRQFLNDYNIEINTLSFIVDDYGYHLTNKVIETAFIKYHNKHATVIFIDTTVHDMLHSD